MKNLSKVRGMGRLAKLGLVVGGLGVAGVMAAGPSFASTPSVNGTTASISGSSAVGGNQGKGTQANHYTAVYPDPVFGSVSCVGVHQVKTGSTTQDSFTCTSTSGPLGGGFTPNETITLPGAAGQGAIPGWVSDWDGAYAKTFSAIVSSNGMSYTAVATYPNI
jgi:hypothetical protein